MYIEFILPDSRLAAQWVRAHINKDVELFCYHHQYTYQNELVYGNKFRIRFDQCSAYTMFALEWQGKHYTLYAHEDSEYPDIHPDYID